MYRIIDAHTHIYPDAIADKAAANLGSFYGFTVPESGTFSDLLRCERDAGIGGFLLLPVATSARNVDKINEAAAAQVKCAVEAGLEAYAFGTMHRDYPDFSAGLDRCAALGLLGIKLHPDLQGEPADSERMFSLCAELERRGIPLWLHVGDARREIDFSSPERVARIAAAFPRLTVVAAHLGGYREWEKAERILMGRYQNVFFDCSSTLWDMTPERGRQLIEACGVDRVMFGSDYPAVTPGTSLAQFLRLGFPAPVNEAILCRNFRRIILGAEDAP